MRNSHKVLWIIGLETEINIDVEVGSGGNSFYTYMKSDLWNLKRYRLTTRCPLLPPNHRRPSKISTPRRQI